MPLYYQNWSYKHKTSRISKGQQVTPALHCIHISQRPASSQCQYKLVCCCRLPLCSLNEQVLEPLTAAGSYQRRVTAQCLTSNERFLRQVISCCRKPCHLISCVPASHLSFIPPRHTPTTLFPPQSIMPSDTSSPPASLLPLSAQFKARILSVVHNTILK